MSTDFLAETGRELARHRRHARFNHHCAFWVLALSIGASFAAAVLVAIEVNRYAVVAVSALPGTMLVLNSTLRFDQKAQWHARKAYLIDAILRAVRFEELPVAEASRRLSEVQQQAESTYPGFANLGGARSTG